MTNEPIPGKILVTPDNVERIIETAAKRRWTIGHLRDAIAYNIEDFDAQTMLYTAIYTHHAEPQIATFNDVPYYGTSTDDVPLMDIDQFIALIEMMPEFN